MASPTATERRQRWIFLAAFAATLLIVYGPALRGDWVWDDHAAMEDPARILDPWSYFTKDVFTAVSNHGGNMYRPLCFLSYVPDQGLAPGPFSAKLGNVALLFGAAVLVRALALELGATPIAAAFGALLFAFHPGASEPVMYAVCRHVTVPAVLLLGSWLALLKRRDVLAGTLAALTPFAGEYYMLAFVTLGFWMVAMRRFAPWALGLSFGGLLTYLGVREVIGVSFFADATQHDLHIVGALGGFAVRGFELLLVPTRADIVFPFTLHEGVGIATIVVFLALTFFLPGRPAVAAILAPLWILLPCALISAQTDLVADRYYYFWFCSLGVAAALFFHWLPRVVRSPLWVAVPALAYATWVRGFDWKNDFTLFESSLAQGRHERAAFFLAFYHHEAGDCPAAIPFYQRAIHVDVRAGPNLQACLVELGRHEEAAALGPELVSAPVVSTSVYTNTARALARLGRLEEAEGWAIQGTERSGDARALVLLGNIRGMRGDIEGAAHAFENASRIAPNDPEVQAGLRAVAGASADATTTPQ